MRYNVSVLSLLSRRQYICMCHYYIISLSSEVILESNERLRYPAKSSPHFGFSHFLSNAKNRRETTAELLSTRRHQV